MEPTNNKDFIFRLLKKSRYLKNIADPKIYKLAQISHFQKLEKGKTFLHQNEKNHAVYILLKGSVCVSIDKEHIYTLRRAGDVFGEMSVITDTPSNATSTADKDTDLIRIPSMTLRDIHGDKEHELHSAFYQWFSNILADKLSKTSQKAKRFETVNRQLQWDLADAKSVQDRIFSSHTHPIQTLPLTMKCEFSNILGGDLYAVFPVDENCYGILIGDVAGHGTGACLISMMILNLFMTASSRIHSSQNVMEAVNKASLQFMHQGKFVTVFYGIYDTKTNTITYTNAGHHPALVLRAGHVHVLTPTKGIPIGILDNTATEYTENKFLLQTDDRLILFTDAVFYGQNPSDGFQGIVEHIRHFNQASSRQLIQTLYELSLKATQNQLRDDFTLMIFQQK
ncbi:MAG: SpoIIE family protein phosphatase [Proteobacteria bacterium]|nr:SpoIIE family protein phosphatase [Pseudomonadota bacterium]